MLANQSQKEASLCNMLEKFFMKTVNLEKNAKSCIEILHAPI